MVRHWFKNLMEWLLVWRFNSCFCVNVVLLRLNYRQKVSATEVPASQRLILSKLQSNSSVCQLLTILFNLQKYNAFQFFMEKLYFCFISENLYYLNEPALSWPSQVTWYMKITFLKYAWIIRYKWSIIVISTAIGEFCSFSRPVKRCVVPANTCMRCPESENTLSCFVHCGN